MRDHKGQDIIEGRERREIGAIRRFLETEELRHTEPLVAHPLPELGYRHYRRVAKIQLDRSGRVDRQADITEQELTRLGHLRKPGDRDDRERRFRESLLQPTPHPVRLLPIGDHPKQLVVEQGQRLLLAQQAIGEGTTRVGIEHGGKQPLERPVVLEEDHRTPPSQSAKGKSSWRSSPLRPFEVRRRRTPSGVNSWIVSPIGNSRQVMK